MRTGGDLWDHSAKGCVQFRLTHDHIRQNTRRARVAALESQLAEARKLLAECEEDQQGMWLDLQGVKAGIPSHHARQYQLKDDNLARRIAAALKGTTTCDS